MDTLIGWATPVECSSATSETSDWLNLFQLEALFGYRLFSSIAMAAVPYNQTTRSIRLKHYTRVTRLFRPSSLLPFLGVAHLPLPPPSLTMPPFFPQFSFGVLSCLFSIPTAAQIARDRLQSYSQLCLALSRQWLAFTGVQCTAPALPVLQMPHQSEIRPVVISISIREE